MMKFVESSTHGMRMKMKFNSFYGTHNKVESEPGDPIVVEYEYYISDTGSEELRQVGKHDLQAMIQSHEPSVNIHNIIDRVMSGDKTPLEKAKGFFADASEIPGDMRTVLNMAMKGKQVFEELPVEVKEVFGNSYAEFISNPKKYEQYIDSKKVKRQAIKEEVSADDDKEQ